MTHHSPLCPERKKRTNFSPIFMTKRRAERQKDCNIFLNKNSKRNWTVPKMDTFKVFFFERKKKMLDIVVVVVFKITWNLRNHSWPEQIHPD